VLLVLVAASDLQHALLRAFSRRFPGKTRLKYTVLCANWGERLASVC
jgi:hypothetical protein